MTERPNRNSVDGAVPDLTDVIILFLVAILSLPLCGTIVVALFYLSPRFRGVPVKELVGNALVVIPAQFAAYVMVVGFMSFLVWVRHRSGFLAGIKWNMPQRKVAWIAFAGGGGMALGSELMSGVLQRWIPKSLPIDEYFKTAASGYALALFGIFVAPFVEEVFFRGFLYPALARWTGTIVAIGITAAAFSMLHGAQLANSWAPLLILFVVGTVLTVVRARTRSVATCVLVHMGYNFVLFTILWFATQGFRHMERG